jgi:hypothetical protein
LARREALFERAAARGIGKDFSFDGIDERNKNFLRDRGQRRKLAALDRQIYFHFFRLPGRQTGPFFGEGTAPACRAVAHISPSLAPPLIQVAARRENSFFKQLSDGGLGCAKMLGEFFLRGSHSEI